MAAADYRVLERELERAGFVKREGRHKVWRHPSGAVTVTPRSGSDIRGYLNDRAQARRAMKRAGVEVTV